MAVLTFSRMQKQSQQLIAKLQEDTGLSKHLCTNIVQYAKCLPKPGNTGIDENVFAAEMLNRFDLTSQHMISLMFQSLRAEKKQHLLLEDFCKCVCVLLCDDLDKKIDFTFRVYDLNRDGQLNYVELYTFLKPCILSSCSNDHEDLDIEDCVKELTDLVMSTTDTNVDHFISEDEYRDLVKKNVLYLQLLGPCLPAEAVRMKVLNEFENLTEWEIKRKYEHVRAETLNSLESRNPLYDLYPINLELP